MAVGTPGVAAPHRRRLIAPDLVRGLMLLFIGGANVLTSWNGLAPQPTGASLPENAPLADQLAVGFADMFLHERGLPMFALLLGYGIGMIAMSLWRRAFPPEKARRVLARRYLWLAVFGLVHMVLLFAGDIMFVYGLFGTVVALMLTARNKTLLWLAGGLYAVYGLFTVVSTSLAAVAGDVAAEAQADAAMADSIFSPTFRPHSHLDTMLQGAVMAPGYLLTMPILAVSVLPVILLGFVAARRQVLAEVEKNQRLLAWWCLPGALTIVFVGLPWALADTGVLPVAWAPVFEELNGFFGWLVGPSAVAAIALATRGMQQRIDAARAAGGSGDEAVPGVLVPVVALGRQSMTGYVGQSLLFVLLAKPYTLDLLDGVGPAGGLALTLGIWLITAAFAWICHAAGKRGPLEVVHRRLAYGKGGLPRRWPGAPDRRTAQVPSA